MPIHKRSQLIIAFLFYFTPIFGQYFPSKDIVLNYNSVCFEFPFEKSAEEYELIIYENEPASSQTFKTSANKIIVPNLAFGSTYFWKIRSKARNKVLNESSLNHFSIAPFDKTNNIRFNTVTKKKALISKEYFVYDYAQIMIDHNTDVTWFLPDFLENGVPTKGVRDLKMTRDGTFLALIDSMGFELDIRGNILWKAPNTGTISHRKNEDYHHDIQKLENGNYVLLGNERLRAKFKGERDSVTYESGFVVEYSPAGEIQWFWRARDFFTPELLSLRKKENGLVNPATHMNSFHIDGDFVFVGFRDASWILKIEKKSKKVVEIYGGHDSGLPDHFAQELFRFQHDTEVLPDLHAMAIINNDSIEDPEVASSMLIFSLGDDQHEKGELLFRFPFKYDNLSNGKSQKLGNVTPLKNGNYLINMGALNRVVEIQPSGDIVWDSFTDKYDSIKEVWRPFQQYRVSTVSSLYPNEFSVKLNPVKIQGENNTAKVTIYNVGSDDYSYRISYVSGGKQVILNESTGTIYAGQDKSFTIEIPKNISPNYIEVKAIYSNKSVRLQMK